MRKLIFSFKKKDFKIDTFRCGGKGGQNQNKRDTGVRITHIESGLSSESREHRTQLKNKKSAFRKLVKKIVDHYIVKEQKERFPNDNRVIRTYNECEDRITDHQTKKQYSFKNTLGKGKVEQIIEERRIEMLILENSE